MNLRLKINKSHVKNFLYGFLGYSAFIFPEYLSYSNSILAQIASIWFWFVVYTQITLFLIRIKSNLKKMQGIVVPFCLLLLFLLFYFFTTVICSGQSVRVISQGLRLIAMSIFTFNIMTTESDSRIRGAVFYFELLTYVTLILQIIYPSGLYNYGISTNRIYTFLGHQNSIFRSLLPGIMLSVLCYSKKDRLAFRTWILIIANLILALLLNSSTSIVALSVTVICLILFGKKKYKLEFINYKNLILVSISLCILVVFLSNITFYSSFVENILGKSITFSGRTLAWDRVILEIFNKPLFGHGYGDDSLGYKFWNATNGNRSCHNFFLDITYRTGIVGLSIILMFFFVTAKDIDSKKLNLYKLETIALISLFISINFEPYVDNELCYAIIPILIPLIACSNSCELKELRIHG